MTEYMVLIQPWNVGVKLRSFFIEQGGLRQSWGKAWRRVSARSIEAARRKGRKMYRFERGKKIQCVRKEFFFA